MTIDEDAVEHSAMIWVPELPGLFVRGSDETQAIERLRPSIIRYIKWMGPIAPKVLGNEWNGRVKVQEIHSNGGNFFQWDSKECTSLDVENHLDVLRKSRQHLETLVLRMPREAEDWKPVPFAPRSPKLIALHIAATEIWYLNQFVEPSTVARALLGEPFFEGTGVLQLGPQPWYYNLGRWYTTAPLLDFMRAARRVFEAVITNATAEDRRKILSSQDFESEEPWTLRKVLRRAAWHEQLHLVTIERFLKQYELESKAKASAPSGSIQKTAFAMLTSRQGELIQLQVSSIHPEDRKVYASELASLLEDPNQDLNVRRAAADSLIFLGDPRINPVNPHLVRIPAGAFRKGTPTDDAQKLASSSNLPREIFLIETPELEVFLPDYEIARYPVTNLEYLHFVNETDHKPPGWWHGTVAGPSFLPWKANHPVWGVSWDDAVAYCEWLSDKTGKKFRLPTENEWEKAARSADGGQYPWGNRFDQARCNTHDGRFRGSIPVGLFVEGKSPYGLLDAAGSVEEWTQDRYDSLSGTQALPERLRFIEGSEDYRITKSGGWTDDWLSARCSFRRIRRKAYDSGAGGRVGFRVVSQL